MVVGVCLAMRCGRRLEGFFFFRMFSGSDALYEFVEGVDFGFGLLLWRVVGADHAGDFASGLNHISVAGVFAEEDLLEAINDHLAGAAGLVAVVLLERLQVFLCVFTLEDASGIAGGTFNGAGVAGVEPGLAEVAGDVVAVEEVALAGV